MATIKQLSKSLEEDRQTSRSLVEECLERTQDKDGEGVRVFLQVHSETARAAADVMDRARKAGCQPSPYAGIPISIKDLFDIAGDVTGVGSKVFVDHPAASTDAKAVARLKSAGFIVIGRTNMTEFAYSGLGINPHFGTPLNPYDRKTGRIPGGSTSGGAVSVAGSGSTSTA